MTNFYIIFGFLSVLIADISQILLKKAAEEQYSSVIKSYLNFKVIFAYFLFFISTICSTIALRHLPLSLSPIWQATGQIFVVIFSYLFLKEKITKRKMFGIFLIVVGICLFAL